MVFFDWGKRDIRSDDVAVLEKVAAEWRGMPGARILLTGHSDRSGPAWTNRRSARLRAEAVRGELVKRGIPARAISTVSYGEQRPVVETEDGVREVQNRRVEISVVPSS